VHVEEEMVPLDLSVRCVHSRRGVDYLFVKAAVAA
jgi:hypothetical protein